MDFKVIFKESFTYNLEQIVRWIASASEIRMPVTTLGPDGAGALSEPPAVAGGPYHSLNTVPPKQAARPLPQAVLTYAQARGLKHPSDPVMEILVLLTDLFDAVGGIQTFNRSLVKAIDEIAGRRKWKVSLLVLNDTGDSQAIENYCDRSRTTYLGFSGKKTAFIGASLRRAGTASTVFLGHANFLPVLIGMRARNRSLQSVLTIYGTDVWGKLPALQRIALRKVDRVLSISESTKKKLVAANNLNGTPINILPCALEPFYAQGARLESRDDLGLPPGKMIFSTSRLDWGDRYKGIEDVIAALPEILSKVPDAFYVIAGDGSDQVRLEQFARDSGVGSKVHFLGRVSDGILPSYYNACDLFVLPSTKEGFGIVFLEAMYYGKACSGARAGAIPEVIEDGVTGLLTAPNEIEALAGVLSRMLLDDALRESMGNAGRARLKQEFSYAMFKNRLESAVFSNGTSHL